MDIVQFILDHAAKEWAVIKGAPAASFILVVLGITLAYVALRWRYSGQIELLKDQVADYRERLGLAPPDKTAYSKLTNQELKNSVNEFVRRLKEFASCADRIPYPDMRNERTQALSNAKTEEEKAQISTQYWQRETAMYMASMNARTSEYEQNYRAQAIVFRDEMLRRLPPQPQRAVRSIGYDGLAGPSPVYDVAMDLERLASLLPQRELRK